MKGVYKRGNKWWIRYRFNGELVRKSIGYDKKLAEETLKAIRGDIVRDEHRLKKNKERRLFNEMVEEYFIEKADKRSLDRDRASLKVLGNEFKNKLIDEITSKDIEAYINKRKVKVSGGTVNREIACLRCMLNIAIKKGYIEQNPAKNAKRLKEAPWRHKYVFSEDEMFQLINAASLHLRPILLMAFGTGLRKGDLLGLRWKDIDFDHGIITVYMQKTESFIEIPMLPMIRRLLENMKIKSNSEYVLTYKDKQIGDIKRTFQTALKESGLKEKGYRFHDIRRTFATLLYNQGVHLIKIQRLLGHKSVLTTERYLGVKFEETRQAIQTLNEPLAKAFIEEKKSTISAQLPVEVPVNQLKSIN